MTVSVDESLSLSDLVSQSIHKSLTVGTPNGFLKVNQFSQSNSVSDWLTQTPTLALSTLSIINHSHSEFCHQFCQCHSYSVIVILILTPKTVSQFWNGARVTTNVLSRTTFARANGKTTTNYAQSRVMH